jgi:PleD family two-component response regulator
LARVLVAEPSLPISAALKKFLESAKHEVSVVHSVAEAVEGVRDGEVEVVLTSTSGNFDGEALCARLRGLKPGLPVILVYSPEEDRPEERTARVGAETFLVGPLKRAAVVATVGLVLKHAKPRETDQLKVMAEQFKAKEVELLKSMELQRAREPKLLEALARLNNELAELKAREAPVKQRLRSLEDEAVGLHAELGKLKDKLSSAGKVMPGGEVAFLKRFLPLEVKRSRRYQYPIAVVLVGLDAMEQRMAASSSPEFQRAAIRSEAMAGIFKVIRDIDLAVPFADDKYLVLLPHTPRDGAMTVASRLQAQLSKMDAFDGGTASAGVASYEPKYWHKEHVSFGGLMRDATAALLKAQGNGGGYVEATPMPDKPKRDRISIG